MIADREASVRTRDDLIAWLTEAAELEHGLMLQYLFAAYTLKKTTGEGLTDPQTELTRNWESLMLHVARQEMAHLAMVSNLLTAIGGRPHFGRPNLPQPARARRPFSFTLERFGPETLDRFVRAEQPQPGAAPLAVDVVPHPPDYDYTGELYRKISEGFETVDADLRARGETLFIGPAAGQDEGGWSTSVATLAAKDLGTAKAVIRHIVEEGEGAPVGAPTSHWSIFKRIEAEYRDAVAQDPTFSPARVVATNPMTIAHPDSGEVVRLVTHEPSRQVAGLFNRVYATTLLMLMQYFDFAGESESQRAYLRNGIRQTMSQILRPLAEILTSMPLTDAGVEMAGPGFELYGAALDVATQASARWTILRERMREEAEGAAEVASTPGVPERLDYVRENLGLRLRNLEQVMAAEPAASLAVPATRDAVRHAMPRRGPPPSLATSGAIQ